MNKILIIGNGGSGKTTLARLLAKRFQISNVIHLDKYYWQNGWRPLREEDKASLLLLAQNEKQWIVECAKLEGLLELIDLAETIIILDLPRRLCLWRVFKRAVNQVKHPHVDDRHVVEWFDFDAYWWIWQYPKRILPSLLKAMEQKGNVIRLSSKTAVRRFIQSLGF